jgi:ABC-type amino acid transport substrate-binding protein
LQRGLPIEATHTFLEGGEVYITLKKSGRNQDFFTSFKNKNIAGMRGYHYGFANFNADPKFLTNNFNMILLDNNADSIKLILRDRIDLAVVTKMFLNRYLKDHPGAQGQLLVSKRFDQIYAHRILVRRSFTPGAKYMEQLLIKLAGIPKLKNRSGPLTDLWKRWGVTE